MIDCELHHLLQRNFAVLLEVKEAARGAEQVTRLGRVSSIVCQHINFHGRFEFLDPPAPIDLEFVV